MIIKPLVAWALVDTAPWGFSLALVATLAYLGSQRGLFHAAVLAFAVVTAFIAALAITLGLAAYLQTLHWMPTIVLPLAYFLIFCVVLVAARGASGYF